MESPLTRRRVIEAGGVGAALSLAGCNSFGSQDTQGSDDGGSGSQVTVFADLDQEALESYQSDLREQVEAGELSQQEARTKAQEKKVELMRDSVQSFEERASENEDLSVADTVPEVGVLLAEGSAEAIVGTLEYEEVHGLLAASEFEQYAKAGSAGQAGGGEAGSGQGDGAQATETSDGSSDGGNDSAESA